MYWFFVPDVTSRAEARTSGTSTVQETPPAGKLTQEQQFRIQQVHTSLSPVRAFIYFWSGANRSEDWSDVNSMDTAEDYLSISFFSLGPVMRNDPEIF